MRNEREPYAADLSSCGPRVGSSAINACTSCKTGGKAKAKNKVAAAARLSNRRKMASPLPGCQLPDVDAHNAADHGGKDDGEESADVEQQQDLAHQVCGQQRQSDGKGEDNIAAHRARSRRLGCAPRPLQASSVTYLFLTSISHSWDTCASTRSATSCGARPVVVTVTWAAR